MSRTVQEIFTVSIGLGSEEPHLKSIIVELSCLLSFLGTQIVNWEKGKSPTRILIDKYAIFCVSSSFPF